MKVAAHGLIVDEAGIPVGSFVLDGHVFHVLDEDEDASVANRHCPSGYNDQLASQRSWAATSVT